MHKIGERVVYGSFGVMEIVDVREEKVLDFIRKYYVLEPISGGNGSQTFVPVENEKLVANMRPLLTKEEVLEFIRSMDSLPMAEWIQDNRARSERFKATIESGDRAGMISMIKLVKATGVRRAAEGKKNYLADENAMHKAEKLLFSEIAAVMGISEEDVIDFIKNNEKRQ